MLFIFRAKDPINVPFKSFFFDELIFPKKLLDFKIKSLNISSAPSTKLIENDLNRFFFDFLYQLNLSEFEQNNMLDYRHFYEENSYIFLLLILYQIFFFF